MISNWEDSFQHNDKYGTMASSGSIEETQLYSYKLTLDVYNSSGEALIMRDIRIAFNDGKNDIHISVPKDDRTRNSDGHISFYNEVTQVNVPPKTIIQLYLHDGEWKDKVAFIWKTQKVYFLYKDKKENEHRILIKSERYSDHFVNQEKEKSLSDAKENE